MNLPALPRTWTLDGFTFNNGVDAFGHSTVVDVPEWWNAPAPRPQVADREGGDGAYQGPNYRAGMIYTLVGIGQAGSPAGQVALRDRLSALCPDARTFYPLTGYDPARGTSLTTWVKLNGQPVIRAQRDGVSVSIDIQVFAADPWRYSPENPPQTSGLATPGVDGILWNGSPAASGGIEWNGSPTVSGGLIYESAQGVSGVIRLTNSGNRKAPIRFVISAGAVNPLLICVQTQERIRWVGTVSDLAGLIIDTKTGRVTHGGQLVNGALSDSEFFEVPARDPVTLIPGTIDVAFSADSGVGTTLMATNSNVYA